MVDNMELRRYDAFACEQLKDFAERLVKVVNWLSNENEIIGEFNGFDVIVTKELTPELVYDNWLNNYNAKVNQR